MKTTAYSWDEVICAVSEWPLDLPEGLTDEDTVRLADAKITQACEDPFGTFDTKVRNEDGVTVLDAQFGQHKACRTYVCLTDPAKAKALAEKELEALLEE